jgi:hypothetical protein
LNTQIDDLKALFEDTSEMLSPFMIFTLGLLVGKTHGKLNLRDGIELLDRVSKIPDKEVKRQIEVDIL